MFCFPTSEITEKRYKSIHIDEEYIWMIFLICRKRFKKNIFASFDHLIIGKIFYRPHFVHLPPGFLLSCAWRSKSNSLSGGRSSTTLSNARQGIRPYEFKHLPLSCLRKANSDKISFCHQTETGKPPFPSGNTANKQLVICLRPWTETLKSRKLSWCYSRLQKLNSRYTLSKYIADW